MKDTKTVSALQLWVASFLFWSFSLPVAQASIYSGAIPVPKDLSSEFILRASYQVSCREQAAFPGITGELIFNGRHIRINLFEAQTQVSAFLGQPVSRGSAETNVTFHFDDSSECVLLDFSAAVQSVPLQNSPVRTPASSTSIATLALQHSPFLVVRRDQYENKLTDLPVLETYSHWINDAGNLVIKYTIFFTDEDSQRTEDGTEKQMARYGRRTDIEGMYEIELDAHDQSVVSERYQGSWLFDRRHNRSAIERMGNIGHSISFFNGEYLDQKSSGHPVLYNIANNNVFSPVPDEVQMNQSELVGYHLVPEYEIKDPNARENALFDHPWIFALSDAELLREGKMYSGSEAGFSDHYLYARIEGDLHLRRVGQLLKAFKARIDTNEGNRFENGHGKAGICHLGLGLWERQAYAAIPIGKSGLARISQNAEATTLHGRFSLHQKHPLHLKLNVDEIRFLKLVKVGRTYETVDVTQSFDCSLGRLKDVECVF